MTYRRLDAISIQKILLNFTGMWPKRRPTSLYKAKDATSTISASLLVLSVFPEVYYNAKKGDYEKLTEQMAFATSLFGYAFKMAVVKIKRRELACVFERFAKKPDDEYAQMGYVQASMEFLRNAMKAAVTINLALVALVTVRSLTGEKANLPLQSSLDFGGYLPFAFVLQMMAILNAAVVIQAVDYLSYGVMLVVASEFHVLCEKISMFQKTGHHFDKFLVSVITEHHEIIRLVERIQNIFTHIFLVQYLEGMLCMCNISFQLAHVSPDSVQFYVMAGYFVWKLQQIGLYCWFGNEIIVQSSLLGYACFKSQWYRQEPKVRRTLFMIMERSKRPSILTAGKFSKVSLASFMGLLNTSYSLFALMQRLYKRSQQHN